MTSEPWPWVPLGDVAQVRSGFAFKSSQWLDQGVPVVKIANVKRGKLDLASPMSHVSESDAEKAEQYRLFRGDILIGMTGYVGEVARVQTDAQLLLNQRVGRVIPDAARVKKEFLYFALSSASFRNAAVSLGSGSAQANVSPTQLQSIPVPCPSIAEQERIAGVLGAFDDLIETNRRLASQLESMTFAQVFAAAADAPSVTFGELATRATEKARVQEMQAGQTYLGLEHFGTDGAGLTGRGTVEGVTSTSAVFRSGDVLYGKLRPYFRKVARPGFDGVCSAEIWVLRARGGHSQAALHAIVHAQRFSDYATAGSGGTKMPRADWKHVSGMPVPDLREALSDHGRTALDSLWSAACELRDEADALSRQRDELLPLLMSGRVRVSELERVA